MGFVLSFRFNLVKLCVILVFIEIVKGQKNLADGKDSEKDIDSSEKHIQQTEIVDMIAGQTANNNSNVQDVPVVGSPSTDENDIISDKWLDDVTTFSANMNNWDFQQSWAKYNITDIPEKKRPIPDYQTSLDHVVLLTQLPALYSAASISKTFPANDNCTLTITQYIQFSDDFQITGTASNSKKTVEIFSLSQDDLQNRNDMWSIMEFDIHIDTEYNLKIEVSSSSLGLWAVDVMTVRGKLKQMVPIVNIPDEDSIEEENETALDDDDDSSKEINPSGNETIVVTTAKSPQDTNNITVGGNETIVVTTTKSPQDTNNITVAANETINNTTVKPQPTNMPPVDDNNPVTDNPVDDNPVDDSAITDDTRDQVDFGVIEEVATAMWNAFYVFLVLFCACLVALIVMIAKQKCRDDPVPPPNDSYSPRASYHLRKNQDNPSFQTDPV